MQVIRNYADYKPEVTGCVLTIGNFDGVHNGHQQLIRAVVSQAKKYNLPSVVITFEPHPLTVLNPEVKNIRINSLRDKIALIKDLDVDILFIIKFSPAFAAMSAVDFAENILIKKFNPTHIISGYDFGFGNSKNGDNQLLQSIALKHGVKFSKIEPVTNSSQLNILYSSSVIRKALQEGDLKLAAQILGYRYFICGKVITGEKRGRLIGYPTANVLLHDKFRPRFGVYAVCVSIENDKRVYRGMANLGQRPTFNSNGNDLLEIYLFNYDGNLYGKRIKVEFIEFIRAEQKFPDINALKAQINLDSQRIKVLHGI